MCLPDRWWLCAFAIHADQRKPVGSELLEFQGFVVAIPAQTFADKPFVLWAERPSTSHRTAQGIRL